jgi:hypothetical protein
MVRKSGWYSLPLGQRMHSKANLTHFLSASTWQRHFGSFRPFDVVSVAASHLLSCPPLQCQISAHGRGSWLPSTRIRQWRQRQQPFKGCKLPERELG